MLDLVRTEGADKRGTARFLAYGVNGLGVTLMIVVFAHTGGMLVGAEAGIAGGWRSWRRSCSRRVFGRQAVRSLADRASRDLQARVAELLEGERRRYTDLLDSLSFTADLPDRLRAAYNYVDDLRFAAATRDGVPGAENSSPSP